MKQADGKYAVGRKLGTFVIMRDAHGRADQLRGLAQKQALERVSPLAVPVMLEIGRETVYGEAADALLAEAADDLVREAMAGATGGRHGGK